MKMNVNSFRALTALMDRVRAFGSVFAETFAGKRNMYEVLGYRATVTYDDLAAKVLRQDIASRLLEADPKAMWHSPPVLKADDAFKDAWNDLVSRHKLWATLYRLDKLLGLGRYSILLMGLNDGKNLAQPADPRRKNEIIYLQVYSEQAATIDSLDLNQTSPRFGLPEVYVIKPNSGIHGLSSGITSAVPAAPMKVHHSRLLHIAENTLEDPLVGSPRMERIYNLLDDLLKTVGGTAEAHWLVANRGMQANIDPDLDLSPEDAAELSDEIEEYQHQQRRFIRTRGVEISNLGSDTPDPSGMFNVIMSLISGTSGIPQRILLGAEAGQLASEQDRANWAARVIERRSLFAEPSVLNPLIARLIQLQVLPIPGELSYLWPDAFLMSPLEEAQASAQKARTLANVAKALSDPTSSPITRDEGRVIIGLTKTTPIFDDTGDTQIVTD